MVLVGHHDRCLQVAERLHALERGSVLGHRHELVDRKPEILELTADKARETYEEYAGLTRDVTTASRQNTNVLSLSLSMGQKRKVTARCQEILQSMKDLMNKREFKGTR